MARVTSIDVLANDPHKSISRSLQSGHINFLIGSGASMPAIAVAGDVEKQIEELAKAGKDKEAKAALYAFLSGIQEPTNKMISDTADANNAKTLKCYEEFLRVIELILTERRTNLLPKQATIFSTNYDLFVEKASTTFPSLNLNDGFSRSPRLDNLAPYSPRNFFNAIYNTGNLYNYRVEVPCINLVKLHGSLSWRKAKEDIVFNASRQELLPANATQEKIDEAVASYAIVLPQAAKFRTTLIDRTYYELLRIYSNQLDQENALLVAFGFSFNDEHILDVTRRALKNPTLRMIVFAFDAAAATLYGQKFNGFGNVEIVARADGATIAFDDVNRVLASVPPKAS